MATNTPTLTPQQLEDTLLLVAPSWQQICKELQLSEEEVKKLHEGNGDPTKADDSIDEETDNPAVP